MSSDIRVTAPAGFVAAPDEGQAFWFLKTLTITKVSSGDSQGRLSIAGHRVPPGFAPPPYIHHHSDQAFYILDGDFAGFCGDQHWRPGPAAWCSCRASCRTSSPSPVERYAPLVWSICRRYRLTGADTDQAVWLHLVDQLDNIRDPAALAGWLATTTQRECCRILRTAQKAPPPRSALDPGEQADVADDELLRAERHAALREAFTHLPPRCQQLIALLIEDPPVPYVEISARLGIPVGSIGPTRSRCLDRLRRHPAVAALINAEANGPQDAIQARGGI